MKNQKKKNTEKFQIHLVEMLTGKHKSFDIT